MKQKLTRALIDEIRKEMPVLSQNEEKRSNRRYLICNWRGWACTLLKRNKFR